MAIKLLRPTQVDGGAARGTEARLSDDRARALAPPTESAREPDSRAVQPLDHLDHADFVSGWDPRLG